jgi:glutamate-1-semialdehyde aminotransferase
LQGFFTDTRLLRNRRDRLRADKKKAVAFGQALIREDINCTTGGKLYLSLAHTDHGIDRTIEIATAALRAMA